jgi:hypothetical protein
MNRVMHAVDRRVASSGQDAMLKWWISRPCEIARDIEEHTLLLLPNDDEAG